MKLIENKIYLIQNDYFEEYNEKYFRSLQSLVYTHSTHRMDDGVRHFFVNPIEDFHDSVANHSLSTSVFENEHQFLKYTLSEAERVDKVMDTFIQNKIKKSQETNPEEWI